MPHLAQVHQDNCLLAKHYRSETHVPTSKSVMSLQVATGEHDLNDNQHHQQVQVFCLLDVSLQKEHLKRFGNLEGNERVVSLPSSPPRLADDSEGNQGVDLCGPLWGINR